MTGWVCQWKPFWILVEDSFKKAYLEEWVFISDVPSEGPSSADECELILETPRVPKLASSSPWSQRSPRIKHVFGNVLRHHCLRCGHDLNVISFIRNSSVPFPNAWSCPFRVLLSCQATRNLSPQVRITLHYVGKDEPSRDLAEHVVDIHKVVADFRTHGVNKYFSSQSPAQKMLSIYNWNPGPRRGEEDASEKQIAGKSI